MEELLKRYSEPEHHAKRLRHLVERIEALPKGHARINSGPPRVHNVDKRLASTTIDELAQAYLDGSSTAELQRRYELGQSSVLRLLASRGVEMRGQGLNVSDISVAARLYRSGATLAQLGEQFGVAPNTVRRALVASGVTMRARMWTRAEAVTMAAWQWFRLA